MYTQTQQYLDKQAFFTLQCQSGFRKQFSSHSCLFQLSDYIINGRDKGLHTEIILIDLKKAFDTLDYNVLLEKMECIGF